VLHQSRVACIYVFYAENNTGAGNYPVTYRCSEKLLLQIKVHSCESSEKMKLFTNNSLLYRILW